MQTNTLNDNYTDLTLNDNYTDLLEKQILSITKLSLPNELSGMITKKLKEVVFEERRQEMEKLEGRIEKDLETYKESYGWEIINNKYQRIKAERDLIKMIKFEKELEYWKLYVSYNMDGGYHKEMNMKNIKELCKTNQIKLSKVVNNKRVAYAKKELLTKLKKKKII
jgi:hypothetical protein